MSHAVAAEPDYPEKLFYRINEVSRITGIKPYVLRYWETEFPQLKPSKDGGDQRRYKAKDIDLIIQIKSLLYEDKFTIAGARKALSAKNTGAPARVVEVVSKQGQVDRVKLKKTRRKLSDVRREIKNLYNFLG